MLALSVVPDLIGDTPPPVLAASSTVAQAARSLVASGERALALVDDDGRFVALITAETFVRFVAGGGDAEAHPAVSLAPRPVDTLAPDDSALDALTLMTRRGLSHLPVLNEDGRLIGILSQARVLDVAEAALDRVFGRVQREVFGQPSGSIE
jgi:CBS domain-containing protein